MMTPERWSQIKNIFVAVLDRPAEERQSAVVEACQGDIELQAELRQLLAQNDEMGKFLDGDTPPSATSLLNPGYLLAGRYEIVALLGSGGMGEVYEAEDKELGGKIALKVIHPQMSFDPATLDRFRREVQLARQVTHPNVCRVFDIGHHQRQGREIIFLTMELVRGETLSARLKRTGKINTEEALPIAIQLCQALVAAHQAGILHRDFKCGNVMLIGAGEKVRAVVTDFGIARWMRNTDDSPGTLTSQGAIFGTPAYMSPEQIQGKELTAESDIYSLGLVLYEMVTGRRPFQDESPWAEALKRLTEGPPGPSTVVPGLAPRWNHTIARCLQRDLTRRFANAQEVSDSLQHPTRYSWKTLPKAAVAAALCLILALTVMAIPSARRGLRSLAFRLMPAGHNDSAVPDEPFALRSQAQVYLERWDVPSNLDRAITMLNRALELDHDYAPAYASLTFAYFEKNRLNPDPQWVKQATQSSARALQLNGDLADSHLATGVAAMLAGRTDEAEREFRKASDLEPKSSKPHRWLGILSISAAKNQQAENELARALALNAEDWRARMNQGLLYYKTARFPAAADAWEEVSKLTPGNTVVLSNLAAVYHMMNRHDDAASALQRSLEIKPDADTYSNLGTLRFFQGRYDEAVPAFEKAANLSANNYVIWGNLGDAYRWAPGQAAKANPAYENAIRLAREALAVNPGDLDVKSSLALYLAKSNDRQGALAQVSEVSRAPKRPANVLFNSAIVHEICGERDQALAALSAALRAGYALKEVRDEPELLALRTDTRYQFMVAGLSGK
jgi:serine/threonine protein kinase/Flp pilus assembly protein TadD